MESMSKTQMRHSNPSWAQVPDEMRLSAIQKIWFGSLNLNHNKSEREKERKKKWYIVCTVVPQTTNDSALL